MVLLKVKWGKVEFDLSVDPSDQNRQEQILSQIFAKTNIPMDKIKVLPSTVLAASSPLKEGMRVTVIGTAQDQQLSAAPAVPVTQFVEDMTADEIATALRMKKAEPLPVGLENLGNTCYLNAVMQCLTRLKLFKSLVAEAEPAAPNDAILLSQLSQLFHVSENSSADSFTPAAFVTAVRSRFPQFNQMDNHGHYAQQDADEFFRSLLTVVSNADSKIESLFGFTMESTWKCLESADEPNSSATEHLKSLTCHMGTQLEPVNHLHEGIQLSLKETIEKSSSVLARTAKWEKKSGLASLPPYMMVQFARFQWKAKSDSAGTEATKTKITRKVGFQKSLDMYDFCTDQVKAVLDGGREMRRKLIEGGADVDSVQLSTDSFPAEASEGRLDTGVYELVAIVSHQGRTSDGGHYMGWIKRSSVKKDAVAAGEVNGPPAKKSNKNGVADSDPWIKFDDEFVTETTWSAMTETGGMLGGLADSQMAYLLFYAKCSVPSQ